MSCVAIPPEADIMTDEVLEHEEENVVDDAVQMDA
jgi:hypothetical protein